MTNVAAVVAAVATPTQYASRRTRRAMTATMPAPGLTGH
jgi:hypothetical protein